MRIRTKLDYDQLIVEIKNLNHRKKLFKILKRELSILGYWKAKPRGNPKLGYKMSRGKNDY
jgi:hypothetical protein